MYLICGVLSVVLFFKIWGMTNDVRAMRKSFLLGQAVGTNEEDFQKLVRRCRLLGNDDKVAELLIDRFCYQAQRALKRSYGSRMAVRVHRGRDCRVGIQAVAGRAAAASRVQEPEDSWGFPRAGMPEVLECGGSGTGQAVRCAACCGRSGDEDSRVRLLCRAKGVSLQVKSNHEQNLILQSYEDEL